MTSRIAPDRVTAAIERTLLHPQEVQALERLHDKLDWMEGELTVIAGRIEAGELPIEVLAPSADFYTNARAAFAIYSRGGHYGGAAAELYIIRLQALAAHLSRVERAFRTDMSRWTPVDREITCPRCLSRHIDRGQWRRKPHRTHLCEACDHQWRPFDYPTVGV